MPAWTQARARRVVRRADGTFKTWRGGKTKTQLPKKQNNYQGIATHIGQQFKVQNGRAAKVGDIHRTQNIDGTYNRQAFWYVRTPRGWRKSFTGTRKPTRAEIRRIMAGARKGRA